MEPPTSPYWRVPLTGHRFDLEALAEAMRTPDLTILHDGGREGFLVSDDFERLDDPAAINDYALQLLDLINGAATSLISDFVPLKIGSVQRVSEGGRVEGYTTGRGAVTLGSFRVRGQALVKDSDGNIKWDREHDSALSEAVQSARQNEDLARVLQLLSDASWVDLYLIHEIMQRVLGARYLRTVGATQSTLDRFTHAANAIARHDPKKFQRPAKPMTRDEAERFIREHVRVWIRSIAASREP